MTSLCIGGLGYAGFPLAVLFSHVGHDVVGYDIDEAKLHLLREGQDPFEDFGDQTVRDADITYRSDPACVEDCEYLFITVPTPIGDDNRPDHRFLRAIGRDIGPHLREGTTVVLESTIYPGGTRDVLVPAITETSDLTPESDFRIGYSPERIVPGQTPEEIQETVKIVGAQDRETADDLVEVYETVFKSVYQTPTIEAAEAAKCLENTQRDVNIALINEFAMACSSIDGLAYEDVLAAAETKWNFHRYEPGLVGGHCIPIDPHYLIHRLERDRHPASLMRTARAVNARVIEHVVQLVLGALDQRRAALFRKETGEASSEDFLATDGGNRENEPVLVAGLTYKPNSNDLRSRPIRAVIERLRDAGVSLVAYDPFVDRETLSAEFDIPAQSDMSLSGFAGLVILTAHDAFAELRVDDLTDEMAENPVFVDLKGIMDEGGRTDSEYIYRRF